MQLTINMKSEIIKKKGEGCILEKIIKVREAHTNNPTDSSIILIT